MASKKSPQRKILYDKMINKKRLLIGVDKNNWIVEHGVAVSATTFGHNSKFYSNFPSMLTAIQRDVAKGLTKEINPQHLSNIVDESEGYIRDLAVEIRDEFRKTPFLTPEGTRD